MGWEERVHVLASHTGSEPVMLGRSAAWGLNPPTLSSPVEGPGASCRTLVLGLGAHCSGSSGQRAEPALEPGPPCGTVKSLLPP